MTIERDLLRMLEPAVRPGGLPGPVSQPRAPLESRSFESLLEEARAMGLRGAAEAGLAGEVTQEAGGSQGVTEPRRPASAGWVGRLGSLDRIENGSLRRLIGGAGGGANVP
jgi:hypothetical protein